MLMKKVKIVTSIQEVETTESSFEDVTFNAPIVGQQFWLLSGRQVTYVACLKDIGFLVKSNGKIEVHYRLCDKQGYIMLNALCWKNNNLDYKNIINTNDIPGKLPDGTFKYRTRVTKTIKKMVPIHVTNIVEEDVKLPNKGDIIYSIMGNQAIYVGLIAGIGFLVMKIQASTKYTATGSYSIWLSICDSKGTKIADYTLSKVALNKLDIAQPVGYENVTVINDRSKEDEKTN